jgi:hypothetical protein
MSQLQLFDPRQCQEHGHQMADIFYKKIQPGFRMRDEGDHLVVGGLSEALTLYGDNQSHSGFMYLKGVIHKMGRPVDESLSLVKAYRYATDPETSASVAHLTSLTQVQGYINQLSIGGSKNDQTEEMVVAPNKAASSIDFADLSQGAALTPHLSGRIGEDSAEGVFKRLNIQYTSQFIAPFYGWGKKGQSRPDFKVAAFDVEPLRSGFYLEVKWRNRYVGGADDAFTALLLNIEAWYDLPTIVLYDGEGAVKDAYEIVRHQMEQKRRKLGDKLLAVMTFTEFVLWAQTQLGDQGVAA